MKLSRLFLMGCLSCQVALVFGQRQLDPRVARLVPVIKASWTGETIAHFNECANGLIRDRSNSDNNKPMIKLSIFGDRLYASCIDSKGESEADSKYISEGSFHWKNFRIVHSDLLTTFVLIDEIALKSAKAIDKKVLTEDIVISDSVIFDAIREANVQAQNEMAAKDAEKMKAALLKQ